MPDDNTYQKGDKVAGTFTIEDGPYAGGFGNVYKVKNDLLSEYCALKVPRAAEDFNKFHRECQNWYKLSKGNHPNIVECKNVLLENGVPHAFAEWMDGGDLGRWIDNGKLYEGREEEQFVRILKFARQAAEGLKFAHEKKFVHKDVKPANIMLTANGDVKVSDFGLASELKQSGSRGHLYAPNYLSGTEEYASPEQFNPTIEKLTIKTDVYSWALSVLSMYLGKVSINDYKGCCPWGNGVTLGYDETERERWLSYDKGRLQIPEQIKILLNKCLQKEPSDRPDFADVIREIDRYSGKEYIEVKDKNNLETEGESMAEKRSTYDKHIQIKVGFKKWARLSIIIALILAGLGILISGLGVFFGWPPRNPPSVADPAPPPTTVEVPNVVGRLVKEARETLEKMELRVWEPVTYEYNATVPEGTVISQRPVARESKPRGTEVILIVSSGASPGKKKPPTPPTPPTPPPIEVMPVKVKVPDVVRMPLEEARKMITSMGFRVGKITDADHETIPKGAIISQSPDARISVESDREINLTVSRGQTRTIVPDVVRMLLEDAKKQITSMGLRVGKITDKDHETISKGVIISQSPEAGISVESDREINLTVSRGASKPVVSTTSKDTSIITNGSWQPPPPPPPSPPTDPKPPKYEFFGGYSFMKFGEYDNMDNARNFFPYHTIDNASTLSSPKDGGVFSYTYNFKNSNTSVGLEVSLRYNSGSIFSATNEIGDETYHLGLKRTDIAPLGGLHFAFRRNRGVIPFFHVLAGISHNRLKYGGDGDIYNEQYAKQLKSTSFAVAIGGGFDYKVSKGWAVRLIQGDYYLTDHPKQPLNPDIGKKWSNNINIASGFVYSK